MMLVHGEAEKMEFLKQKIVKEFCESSNVAGSGA